jgi:hypothetical protein
MTLRFQRYAIYWTPEPESRLARFGEAWFANALDETGAATQETFGLACDFARRATKTPARYGVHATLKAPFRLREGATEADLQKALDSFCAMRRGVDSGPLRLASFQGYLGLVLSSGKAGADWLAAECVTQFDHFRAPLSETDRNRRDLDGMSKLEAEYFEAFGYPYILSEFLFHVTLAGPMSDSELAQVREALEPRLAWLTAEPLKIGSLSLLGEPEGAGAFELLSRHRFKR